ncbi:hypothetical protein SCP_0900930 [Sparassis crispa]|uniref:Secreted protein n=1 Tax=Sparassis crispa TaxID=139825 RepID=A0A401GWR8_9APHY|nr:hypothetical protein SCP_0900930 [Sparassis crispa]GBE86214.1 hypothetical protein SCP_0900930 [Sparassis crispa]
MATHLSSSLPLSAWSMATILHWLTRCHDIGHQACVVTSTTVPRHIQVKTGHGSKSVPQAQEGVNRKGVQS